MDWLYDIIRKIDEFISFKNIVGALIAFIVCFVVIKLVMRAVSKALKKSRIDPTLHTFIGSVIEVILYIVMIMIIAGTLGIETSSMVALFSVIGLAVSLAVQDSLANMASGITILLSKPFAKGDFVELGGISGTVDSVGLLNTSLRTPDNKIIFVPNSTVCGENIINYSHETTRRIEIKVSASYESPVKNAKEALLEAADMSRDKILESPAVFVGVINYGSSAIEYVLRLWVKSADYWDVYFKIMEDIQLCFEKHNVEMTYDHIIVHKDK